MYTCWQVAMKHRLDEGVVCFVLIFAFLLVSLVLGLVRLLLWIFLVLLWFLGLVMTCVDLLMGFNALYAELLCSDAGSRLVWFVASEHDLVTK
jgi:hypothetical protein